MLEEDGELLEKRIFGPIRERDKQEAGGNFIVRRICMPPLRYCRLVKKGERDLAWHLARMIEVEMSFTQNINLKPE
jgi:hypothetical protein